jgi:hypothetical protein
MHARHTLAEQHTRPMRATSHLGMRRVLGAVLVVCLAAASVCRAQSTADALTSAVQLAPAANLIEQSFPTNALAAASTSAAATAEEEQINTLKSVARGGTPTRARASTFDYAHVRAGEQLFSIIGCCMRCVTCLSVDHAAELSAVSYARSPSMTEASCTRSPPG